MPILPEENKVKNHDSIWQMSVSDILLANSNSKIPSKDLTIFCRKMSYLLGAGLPLKETLFTLQDQTKGTKLSTVVPQLSKHVLGGRSLSTALRIEKVFPEFMIGYISIGEKTAQLAKVCEKLADYYEQQSQLKKELTAALVYPITVLVLMMGVIILAMVTVLPGYAQIFEASNIALPAATEILINISSFFVSNVVWIATGFIALLFALIAFTRSKVGKGALARIQLKIPLLRQGLNVHFAQALSILLTSGVRISEAMPLCIDLIENIYVKQDLDELSKNLSKGTDFSEALNSIPYIDPLLYELAQVGEKTGDLPQVVARFHSYAVVEYMHNIKRVSKLIDPIITLMMGALLALLMLAIVLPTFELATAM